MAIVFLQKNKTQKNLMIVLAAVILATLLVLWSGVFKEGNLEVEETPSLAKREVKINFGVLENPILESFRPFPDIKPFEESTATSQSVGRENPFLPY